MRYLGLVTLAFAFLAGCNSKPEQTSQPLPASSTAPTERHIAARVAKGIKLTPIVNSDGVLQGYSIARERGGQTMSCQCPASGCAENPPGCKTNLSDDEGFTVVTCEGSCTNSEGNACGGCQLAISSGGGSGGSGSTGVRRPPEITITEVGVLPPPSGDGGKQPNVTGSQSSPAGNKH